jgi:hypothetical protein
MNVIRVLVLDDIPAWLESGVKSPRPMVVRDIAVK